MKNLTSLVPKYTFPDTLEAQETALAANPLMRRLIESRASYAGDRHRPIYHYVNPEALLMMCWKHRSRRIARLSGSLKDAIASSTDGSVRRDSFLVCTESGMILAPISEGCA